MVYEAYKGNFGAARRALARLAGDTVGDKALALQLQVSSGEPVDPTRGLLDPAQLRWGLNIEYFSFEGYFSHKLLYTPAEQYRLWSSQYMLQPPSRSSDEQLAFWGAMMGEGQHLASLVAYGWTSASRHRRAALAVIPYVVRSRAELREAARGFRRDHESRYGWFPAFDMVFRASEQRNLMRVTGNTALATHWQEIVDRHARVLSSRERVIALTLWSESRL